MNEIDIESGVQKTCANCWYCKRGEYYTDTGKRLSKKKLEKWYCEGHETSCLSNVDDPQKECCEHWEIY